MLQDSATTEENYKRFIKRVLEFKKVWGLRHPDGGWATCPSNEHEGINVYVFGLMKLTQAGSAKKNGKVLYQQQ